MRNYDALPLSREMHKLDIQRADRYTFRRLRSITGLVDDKLVLDVGCGCGLLHRVLGEEITYIGVDFVRKFLTGANWLGYSSAYKVVASTHALPFRDNSIHSTVCSEVLEHLPYDLPKKCLSEIFRVLEDGGSLVLSVPNFSHLTNRLHFLMCGRIRGLDDLWHVQFFTANSLRMLLKTVGFKVTRRYGFDIILEPNNLLTHIVLRIPYSLRKHIANSVPLLDQLILLKALKREHR